MQTALQKSCAARAPRKISAGSAPTLARSPFPRRREFLALPLARRREILKAQALAARGYYTHSSDWRQWVDSGSLLAKNTLEPFAAGTE
jgi:hypothetical protein